MTVGRTKLSVMLCPSESIENIRTATSTGNAHVKDNYGDGQYSANNGWPRQATGYNGERTVGPSTWPAGNGALSLFTSMLGPAYPEPSMLSDYPTLKPPVAWRVSEKTVVDGLTKTAAFSEHLTNSGAGYSTDPRRNQYYFGDGFTPKTLPQLASECERLGAVTSFTFGLGGNWLGPNYEVGNTYQHLLTPNKRNCRYGDFATESQLVLNGANTAGSRASRRRERLHVRRLGSVHLDERRSTRLVGDGVQQCRRLSVPSHSSSSSVHLAAATRAAPPPASGRRRCLPRTSRSPSRTRINVTKGASKRSNRSTAKTIRSSRKND